MSIESLRQFFFLTKLNPKVRIECGGNLAWQPLDKSGVFISFGK